MSNPVSNTEIEDVLSSIRRLVNEEARNIVAASQPQREEKPTKLVLTQSLRVEDEVPEAEPAEERETAETSEPLTLVGESQEAEFHSQRTVAVEDIEPVEDSAQGTAPDAADEVDDHAVFSHHSDADEADDHGDDFIFVREAKLKLRAEQRADLQEAETQEVASGEEAENMAEPAPDHEGAPWKDPEATLYAAARAGEAAPEDVEPEDDGDAPVSKLEAIRSAPLGSKIEAFEAAIGETEDQWEPDGDVGDDYAGTQVETLQWEDHEEDAEEEAVSEWQEPEQPPELEAEADVIPEPDVDYTYDDVPEADLAEEDADEDALDMLSAEESFLDEESLRELVADIVRQELQGALGERITRNVRKLVRREIHRALVAQDLE